MSWKGLHVQHAEQQEEQDAKDIRAKYRILFTSPIGKAVLADILHDLGHEYNPDIDPRDAVTNTLRSYAWTLLHKIETEEY